jgi:MFS family permease
VAPRLRRELGLVIGWLVFPLVPVVLEDIYYQLFNSDFATSTKTGPDPRAWNWSTWLIMLGPLLGYSFLAGATVDIPDDLGPSCRGLRRLLSRRSVWVAIGPWCGFLFLAAVAFGLYWLVGWLVSLIPDNLKENVNLPESWRGGWIETVLGWAVASVLGGILAYGWLWPARAALRRAARIGRLRWVAYRGLLTAMGFVGSLFGSFWAATSLWRSYFFDPRIVPLVALAVSLVVISGCGTPITYGEVRRRELFHAMLVAWVIGLALMWRWWSRPRPGPPRNDRSG